MSRFFTYASTDQISPSGTIAIPATFSYYWWQYDKEPTATSPRNFQVAAGSVDARWQTGQERLIYQRGFSTTGGNWFANTGVTSGGAWHHYAITHDGSSTANTPTFYVDGVAKTTSTTTSPSGTVDTSAQTLTIGNAAGGGRGVGGRMALLGFNNVVLTAAEIITAMRYGYAARGLFGLWPIFGADSPEPDYSGGGLSATVTGTSRLSDPPVPPFLFVPQEWSEKYTAPAATTANNLTLLGCGA